MDFILAKDYAAHLAELISAAQERVLLETMVIDDEGAMNDILLACLEASRRGVSVAVVYDRFTAFDQIMHGRLSDIRRLNNLLCHLQSSGADVIKVGRIRLNPFSGRHHAKAAIVDDRVLIGGGVNLTGQSFAYNDFMWSIDDTQLASRLHEALPKLAASRHHNKIIWQSYDFDVLLDAGRRGASLIYETAHTLAQKADQIYYVSKLMPTGKLGRIIESKPASCWFNTLKTAHLFDKLALFIDKTKYKLDNNYSDNKLLHAKLCVFVMSDGKMEAISGSHNFNYRGVKFGTQEIALHIKNQKMCRQLIEYAESLGSSNSQSHK